jgi:putative DNA primase/helicase
MDEFDTYGGKDGLSEEMRGILNSGHTRASAYVIRLVPVGNSDFESRQFSTFAAIVTAKIGGLPPTLRDRSIPVSMKRKLTSDKVERLGGKHKKRNRDRLQGLARQIMRWAQDNRALIAQAAPALPESLDDRASDNWAPLLAIADAIGAGWPALARAAAIGLSGADATESENLGVTAWRSAHFVRGG